MSERLMKALKNREGHDNVAAMLVAIYDDMPLEGWLLVAATQYLKKVEELEARITYLYSRRPPS